MSVEDERAEALRERRADLVKGRADGIIGDPIFDKLDTIEQCANIVEAQLPGGSALVQTLRMAHEEIERLASALLMISVEALVPDAFGDAEAFEKLDEIRQIHCSALLIARATLIGGEDDEDDAEVPVIE
jgi:hypothetical protein